MCACDCALWVCVHMQPVRMHIVHTHVHSVHATACVWCCVSIMVTCVRMCVIMCNGVWLTVITCTFVITCIRSRECDCVCVIAYGHACAHMHPYDCTCVWSR